MTDYKIGSGLYGGKSSASIDARGLFAKFAKLDALAQSGVKGVVKSFTEDTADQIEKLLERKVIKRGKTVTGRSRPGQPPRSDTGRERRSINKKLSPKGWVGTVSTNNIATDSKGRRYPWILESGSKKMRKRPLFKKVQRAQKKPFQRAVAQSMTAAVRSANP